MANSPSTDPGDEREGFEGTVDGDVEADTVRAAVVAITEPDSNELDESGGEIVRCLEAAGHEIDRRERIDKRHDAVQSTVSDLVDEPAVQLIVTTGGTGVEPDDITLEAVRPTFDKDLRGFDTLFTHLAYERIGAGAVHGRTAAGIADGVPVLCLPGDTEATKLAVEEIVCPEAAELVDRSAKS